MTNKRTAEINQWRYRTVWLNNQMAETRHWVANHILHKVETVVLVPVRLHLDATLKRYR
ncbi:hypothetical protein LCGC14_1838730 [marine sediment metagenome]|uniref:Uncharacterized protein n=1 Tax=marine sediment metagenome TaxID=412755 RepID=A0A0F9JD90_9ZZZZ